MEFCPKCEIRLKKNDSGLLHCPKCKYLKEKTVESTKEEPEGANSEFLVMGEDDVKQAKGLESTVPIDCEKCHNKEGVSWTFRHVVQTNLKLNFIDVQNVTTLGETTHNF